MKGFEGDWVGSYTHPNSFREGGGHEFDVEATFSSRDDRVEGAMRDLNPVNTIPFGLLMTAPGAELWPKWVRANMEAFARNYPDAMIRSSLPEHSSVSGSIKGSVIEFEKRYQGPQKTATFVGERQVSKSEVADHRVHYRGVASADGREIVGEWWIRRRGFLGLGAKVTERGDFRLIRRERDKVT